MSIRTVGAAVVGHHAMDLHTERTVERGPSEEPDRGGDPLVLQALDVGDAGGVVDAHMDVLPSGSAIPQRPIAVA